MTPNGKDYDISLEDIMSGDTTSSSSGSGGGTGSETGGQGVSEEVLKNLESLTQRMESLEEKVQTSESTLSDLKKAYSGLTSEGGKGESTLLDVNCLSGSTQYQVNVPEGAKGVICTCNERTWVKVGEISFICFIMIHDGGGDWSVWQPVLIPEGNDTITIVTLSGSTRVNYSFFK